MPLDIVGVSGADAARARELWEADAVLVRPDQHVAWRGDDLAALKLEHGCSETLTGLVDRLCWR